MEGRDPPACAGLPCDSFVQMHRLKQGVEEIFMMVLE
jgi:hypothetical protein